MRARVTRTSSAEMRLPLSRGYRLLPSLEYTRRQYCCTMRPHICRSSAHRPQPAAPIPSYRYVRRRNFQKYSAEARRVPLDISQDRCGVNARERQTQKPHGSGDLNRRVVGDTGQTTAGRSGKNSNTPLPHQAKALKWALLRPYPFICRVRTQAAQAAVVASFILRDFLRQQRGEARVQFLHGCVSMEARQSSG